MVIVSYAVASRGAGASICFFLPFFFGFSSTMIASSGSSVSKSRRFDGAKKVWIVPARSRVDLERMIYQIRQFENINWVNGTEKKEEDIAYDIPELPDLTVPHNLSDSIYNRRFILE